MDCPIQTLPEEILLKILSYADVGSRTILSFGETCKTFHDLVQDPILWKKKLQFRYPKIYAAILLYGTTDYLEQYQYIHRLETKILEELKQMSPKFFWRSKDLAIEDAAPYFSMCGERNISLVCVHSILIDTHTRSGQVIESDYPTTSPYSLTVQYYATHVIRFIMHIFLMMNWRSMKLMPKEISPERTLNFYVNWVDTFQYTHYSVVKTLLDKIADEVQKELDLSHPLHSVTPEVRDAWIDDGLVGNQWESEHNHAVHAAIRHILYTKRALKLDPNLTRAGLHLPSVMQKKKGHAIAIAVLYEAIARRCGVRCAVVAFTDHFFLEWRESYDQPSPQYRVDLITGKLEKKRTCPFASGAPSGRNLAYKPESLINSLTEEFRRTLDNERNASMIIKVEALDDMLHGEAGSVEGHYHNKYMSLLNIDDMTQLLIERPVIRFECLDEDLRRLFVEFASPSADNPTGYILPKRTLYRNRRSSQVHFAVGMVCGHRMYNYTCVVTGWDAVCTAPADWQARMGVQQLAYKAQQPFYNVYATDGTSRYVAQENLSLIVGQRQKSIEDVIGKEFSHFNGTYYIPNVEKQKEYPDEQQVIAAYRRAPTLLSENVFLP